MATLTATELATELNTTGREVRKFLRDDFAAREVPAPGKGSRYSIERKEVASMKKRFTAWADARAPKADAPIDSDEAHPDDN